MNASRFKDRNHLFVAVTADPIHSQHMISGMVINKTRTPSALLLSRHLLPVLEEFGIDSSRRVQRDHPRVALIIAMSSHSVVHRRGIHSRSQGDCTVPHPCFIGDADILWWDSVLLDGRGHLLLERSCLISESTSEFWRGSCFDPTNRPSVACPETARQAF
jgi:hypothetical protein